MFQLIQFEMKSDSGDFPGHKKLMNIAENAKILLICFSLQNLNLQKI